MRPLTSSGRLKSSRNYTISCGCSFLLPSCPGSCPLSSLHREILGRETGAAEGWGVGWGEGGWGVLQDPESTLSKICLVFLAW